MGHSCWTFLRDTLVRHSCRTLLWGTLVGHSHGTLYWDTLVGHSCETWGYAVTRPGHGFQFQQANIASDRSGVSGVHQWSVMLPTSARVAQEVYEPLIGIQYPMLCGLKNGQWHIGTGSIRKHEARTTGLRFVQWMHHDTQEAARADPPPEATAAVHRQIENWVPVEDEERSF